MIFQRISYLGFCEKAHRKEAVTDPIDLNRVKTDSRFVAYVDDTFVFIRVTRLFLLTEASGTGKKTEGFFLLLKHLERVTRYLSRYLFIIV